MIEKDNAYGLQGQYELSDLMPEEPAAKTAEGYDGEGQLINPGAETAGGQLINPGAEAADVPQTSADADRLQVLATEINAITEQTRGVVISAAMAVGKRLIEAKSLCPAGRFGEWLEKSVSYSERKAQDMMRLYVEYGRDGAIPDSIAALDYSKAVALLSAPAEQRESLAAEAAEEALSVRELQKKIGQLNAEKLKAQMRIDDLEGKVAWQKGEIVRLDERERTYDNAIVQLQGEAKNAQAKAKAAEDSAEELRRLHSDAEDRAAASAQRASDAVSRANQAAKDLAEARAKIAELEEAAANAAPEPKTVEVVPDSVQKELDDLRALLAEARAHATPTTVQAAPEGPTASDKFKWFYANQMKPAFASAVTLLREVAKEDAKTADLFATAIVNGCKQLMNQLGEP